MKSLTVRDIKKRLDEKIPVMLILSNNSPKYYDKTSRLDAVLGELYTYYYDDESVFVSIFFNNEFNEPPVKADAIDDGVEVHDDDKIVSLCVFDNQDMRIDNVEFCGNIFKNNYVLRIIQFDFMEGFNDYKSSKTNQDALREIIQNTCDYNTRSFKKALPRMA